MLFTLLLFCAAADPLVANSPVIDRGEAKIGQQLVETFTLTNRSATPISITNVQSSCGCLEPKLDRRDLQPNESTKLTVEINTLSQPAGQMNWPVRVQHSAGTLELALCATLVSEVKIEPAATVFRIRQARSVTVTVADTRAKPFRVMAVGASMQQVHAEVTSTEGNASTIRVTATPNGSSGTQKGFVWITTDDPLYPQIRVPVTLTELPK